MGLDRNTLSGPTACRYSYAHRIPIVDSYSTRSGDRFEARLRWFPIEPELPLLLAFADDPSLAPREIHCRRGRLTWHHQAGAHSGKGTMANFRFGWPNWSAARSMGYCSTSPAGQRTRSRPASR